jgi:hypothetical protein
MADLTITTQDDLPGPGDDRPYVMFVNLCIGCIIPALPTLALHEKLRLR